MYSTKCHACLFIDSTTNDTGIKKMHDAAHIVVLKHELMLMYKMWYRLHAKIVELLFRQSATFSIFSIRKYI